MTAAPIATMTNSFSKQNNKDESNIADKVGEENIYNISDTDGDASEYKNNNHSHLQQELQQQLPPSPPHALHKDSINSLDKATSYFCQVSVVVVMLLY
mmetsp:Transcript_12735/g.14602  ORF Transcript_12735/g.14602 Transcript_12735/m.14602 type:complete len:98 (+) Transcript_12735:664-957(+)